MAVTPTQVPVSTTVPALTLAAGTAGGVAVASTIDAVNDYILVYTASATATQGINRNTFLGITGAPVGTTDTQTLTNKTLTSPTISGPTFSGTLAGTYTIGGTPTFPSSVVTLTGTQTLTNKTLTSPTLSAPTITNATISADAITGFTTANTGTIYGVSITGGTIAAGALGPNSVATSNIQSGAIDYTKVATGFCVQQVNLLSATVATGTTVIPLDNTIPQNTEGDQYMTLSITPKASTNILIIDVTAVVGNSATAFNQIVSLFQGSTANALAATVAFGAGAGATNTVRLTYTMAAGTTSAITFNVRSGANVSGTTTFNGALGTQLFSTVPKSSIIITEYKV